MNHSSEPPAQRKIHTIGDQGRQAFEDLRFSVELLERGIARGLRQA